MLENLTYIGFPITILLFSIISCILFSFAFNKKRLNRRTTIIWLTTNIFFLILSLYLFVIGLVKINYNNFKYEQYNFLQWLAKYIFIGGDKNSWIIFLIGLVSLVAISVSIGTIISFNKQTRKINDLNRNLAILKGKFAIEMNELSFDTSELSFDELKYLLEEQLAKEKLKAKFKSRLKKLNDDEIEINLDTKTLLNIKENNHENLDN